MLPTMSKCGATLEKQVKVLKEVERGMKKKSGMAKVHGILPNTLSTYMKNKERKKWRAGVYDMEEKCKRRWIPDIDECVFKWF